MFETGLRGFKSNWKFEFFEGLRGEGTDAAEGGLACAVLKLKGSVLVDKGLDRRRTGEEYGVSAFLAETFGGWIFTKIAFTRPVNGQGIDDGSALVGFEALNETLAVLVTRDDQYLDAFDAFILDEFLGQRIGVGLFWDEIDLELMLFNLLRGGGTDGGDTHRAETADVVVGFIKQIKEMLHAIGAGEDDPLVYGDAGKHFTETLGVKVLLNRDEGQFDDFGALASQ